MAKPRIPKMKAEVTGAALQNPARFEARNDPSVAHLGAPSAYLSEDAKRAWGCFTAELPWLVESDRALLEVASTIRARFWTGDPVGINSLQTFSAILSKLGATPADRSRVTMPSAPDEHSEFFDN